MAGVRAWRLVVTLLVQHLAHAYTLHKKHKLTLVRNSTRFRMAQGYAPSYDDNSMCFPTHSLEQIFTKQTQSILHPPGKNF